ncbi:MAG: IS66 family transposase [bacterium]|nr:IS66 family transposase [bacterium]
MKAQLADRDAAIADRDAKIDRLAHDLRALEKFVKETLRGRRRGQVNAEGQGVLFPDPPASPEHAADDASEIDGDDDESDDDDQQGEKRRKRKRSRARRIDTSALPCEERVHELPEEERVCPDTGQTLVAIGERLFEEIDFQRAKVTLIRHRQVIYGLAPEQAEDRQATSVTTPLPPRPLENCAASAMLLAWLLVQKFANHLPLYRQERIFERDGLRLPRQTLCDWVLAAAEILQPLADCLMTRIRAGPVMQLDDTPVMCQGGRGESHFQAYLWTFVNPEVSGVVYRFTSGRASELITGELGGFEGFLVGDGYSGNRAAAAKAPGAIVLTGCWAHVTRKFRDAMCEAPGTAQLFRYDIKQLFDVEREADDAGLDPAARASLRREKSRSALAALLTRARRMREDYSDAGKMAGAIGYMLNQRKPLRRFLEDGRVPIHNNSCEIAIRPIAVGRRNWLFAGSLRGGRAAATAYTLIESCRQVQLDVVAYLADVMVRVATHPASRIDELLPENWAATVKATTPTARLAEPALA